MATTQALYCATLTSPCTRRRKLLLAGASSGRIFGLSPDDVGFLLGLVHVPRQVKIVGSQLVFDAPKGGKSRDVPLPESVALELAAHLEAHPVSPWRFPCGTQAGKEEQAVRLILTSRESAPLNRNYRNAKVWKPALLAAGLEPTRENGVHALRHWYASVLLDAGESIRALSGYLGRSRRHPADVHAPDAEE